MFFQTSSLILIVGSDTSDPFFGFDAADIELREAKNESDIDVSDVNSVHTADLSDGPEFKRFICRGKFSGC